MPVDEVLALNQVQKIPEIQISAESIAQPHTFYTCPTDKKALFIGMVIATGVASGETLHLRDPTDSFDVHDWNPLSGVGDWWAKLTGVGIGIPTEFELLAGDVIKTTETGVPLTTGISNVVGKILELPA